QRAPAPRPSRAGGARRRIPSQRAGVGRPCLCGRRNRGRHATDPPQSARHPDRRIHPAQPLGRPGAADAGPDRPCRPRGQEHRRCELPQLLEPLQGVRARSRAQRSAARVHRRMRIGLVAAALALTASPVQAQFRPKDFDAYVGRGLEALRTPGVAIAVVKDGRVVFAKGYGVRALRDTGRVDAHTLFQIASNTKAFTTAALAMLADAGKLSWDDPVTKFLPGFRLYDPYVTREFTVRDLVTHRSGLGLGAGDLLWFHSDYSRGEIAYRIRFAKPASSFRSAYAYDNVLYIVAGEIVPAIGGMSWDDFVTKRILTPLGMSETGTTIAYFAAAPNRAAPHAVERGTLQIVPIDSVDNTAPAGGIVSNVTDLAKWVICRLDSGRYAGSRLFSERQAREMWSGQTILPISDPPPPLAALRPSFAEYGLGWRLRDYRGREIVSHTGGLAGMTSQITLVPSAKLGIVTPTNSEANLMAALTYRLLDDLLGAPPPPRPPPAWVAASAQRAQPERPGADSSLRSP